MNHSTPQQAQRTYDTFHMGRSCMDLYSNDVGAAFIHIKSFAAYVGGSPANMSVGCRRLGLNSALLTAFGEDPVGDFVIHFLTGEGVDIRFSPRKPGRHTSLVVMGIEPPDRFPLVFYRENCADIALEIDDVLAAPIHDSLVFQFAGTNLSRETSRSATFYAAELARKAGTSVVLDLDFRPDQWHDPRAYGAAIRSILYSVDMVMGTEDEINAAMLTDPDSVRVTHSQVTDARVPGNTAEHVRAILDRGPRVVVEKRGKHGCRIHERDNPAEDVPGFPVTIQNILGAGDAFGAGFLYGYVKGWDLRKAAQLGNACGAIVVTRHGCSISMPTLEEVMGFVSERSGL
ncbi:MAG: 5-dehydro-2-deoxygluconokinase [Deltaproteobacteria bacterium RBG_16_49_23]|nr:MAG: 5-dehydro-2-deoxygluconokinase [Deltaproteobacteria bacterium RBG_16_49_23]